MTDDRKKPGPDPERLVIEDDPEEALGRLLGRKTAPRWTPISEALPPTDKAVEVEDRDGNRHRIDPGGQYVAEFVGQDEIVAKAVRWRIVEDDPR